MKRVLAILLAALMLLSLAACGSDNTAADTPASTDASASADAASSTASSGAKLRFVTGGDRKSVV